MPFDTKNLHSVFPKAKVLLVVLTTVLSLLSGFTTDGFCQESFTSRDLISFSYVAAGPAAIEQIFGDFDSDGIEEFIWLGTDRKGALLVNFDGPQQKSTCHLRGDRQVAGIRAVDMTGDPSPEIFLCMKEENKTWIEVYDVFLLKGVPKCSLYLRTQPVSGKDTNGDGKWDGQADRCQVLDLNNDGRKDILSSVNAEYDRKSRGVWAFDGRSGEELWKFLTAGPVQDIFVIDASREGAERIILGTWAPANTNTANKMSDVHSYLICLDKKGAPLWADTMGGVYSGSRFTVGDVDEDGRQEIVCTFATGDLASRSTEYEIQIREAETGRVRDYLHLPTRFGYPFLADLDRDRTYEIAIANENRTIYVLDERLRPEKEQLLPKDLGACGILQIADVNQDGELEIIARAANNILVFDGELRLLGRHQMAMVPWMMHFFKHPHYGGLLSVVQGEGECVAGAFIKLESRTGAERAVAAISRYGVALLVFIFLCGIGIALFFGKIGPSLAKKLASSKDQKVEDRREKLLMALSGFGHGRTLTANLDRLNLLFKNLSEDQLPAPEYRKKLDETVKTYSDLTSNQLLEIVKRSRSAKTGREHATLLEKNLRKLEGLLADFQRKGLTQEQTEKLSRQVPITVESIETSVEHVWSELARYYSCDIILTMQEVLAAVSPEMRKQDVRFKNLIVEGDMGAMGFVGKSDFATLFEELNRNAIRSMKNSPVKEIIVGVSVGERKITVTVADTGCGMEEAKFSKIFDREYSTKPEGGFGLYHAKSVLSQYGGKIKVAQSKPGSGTTMQVELKRI